MKHYRLGTLLVLIAAWLIGAPAGFAQSGLSIHTARPTRLTVAPNVSSAITIKTLPQATCVLHAEGVNDDEHRMKLFADDEGMVRVHVNPDAESEEVTRFQIDCAANGKISMFPLELRSSSSPTTEMPAPAVEVAKEQPGTIVLPALTEDEALRLSDEELAIRLYPERPNREQAPGAFAQWLKLVTKPLKFVPSQLVNSSDVKHDFFQLNTAWAPSPSRLYSRNWSGYVLDGRPSGTTYDLVRGIWYVPAVTNQYPGYRLPGVASAYSSFWIGLDGYQTDALAQGGTEQDVWTQCRKGGFRPICFTFHNYYAFAEFLASDQKQGGQLMGFPVNPGDQIFASLYFGKTNQTPDPAGILVWFDITNFTQSVHTTVPINRCSVGNFCVNGYTAEWIMERPTVNGALPYLASYYSTLCRCLLAMDEAYVRRGFYSVWENFDGTPFGDKSWRILMANDPPAADQSNVPSDVLSTTVAYNSSQILFAWYDFY